MNPIQPRRAGREAVTTLGIAAVLAVIGLVTRSDARRWRVVVQGASMLPALEPGDRLVCVPAAWTPRRVLRPGDIVALRDPRGGDRVLVKRVHAVLGRSLDVRGDNPSRSTDSRSFGPVAATDVAGRAVYRYAPASRSGRIHRLPSA